MRRGFSLLEAVASLFLLSIVIVLAVNLLPSTRMTLRKGENLYQARVLAQSALARAQAVRFQDLASADLGDANRNGTVFRLERKVQPEGDRLRRVTVTVTWNEKTGPKELVSETLVADVPR